MTLDATLSVSCAVFVSASDRLLAKMSHFTLFAALFFLLAATEQKEEPVTWGQRSQRSHRCLTLGTPFGILSSGSRHSLCYQMIKERQMPNGLENAKN